MEPVKIAENIYNVGVIDWNIRDFHGYSTEAGTSYNAFLIVDEKITLIDTVKSDFTDQLIANIARIIDPRKIDIVISNHTEMDHTGALPRIMHYIGEDKPLFCSKMGKKNLSMHFHRNWNYRVVQNGESVSIGSRSLTFLETRMLHWPDSMFTYMPEEKILFSSDAFGQHYADYRMFDDRVDKYELMQQAKKYFANILLLYAPRILKLADQISSMGLEIRMICPDHGIIWREDPNHIVEAYVKWANQVPEKKAVIVYDTMWKSTKKMAEAIAEGIDASGVPVRPVHIRSSHRSDIMTEILDAAVVVVGSPTLNNNIFPTVADILAYIKGLKPKNKLGASFGSYGWSGEAPKMIAGELESMGMKLVAPPLRLQYVPDSEGRAVCFDFGKKIAEALSG